MREEAVIKFKVKSPVKLSEEEGQRKTRNKEGVKDINGEIDW